MTADPKVDRYSCVRCDATADLPALRILCDKGEGCVMVQLHEQLSQEQANERFVWDPKTESYVRHDG